jgi:serine/threonine protein kinase
MNQTSNMFGVYRIQHKLGEGGMGAVYMAEHSLLGRRAAIKVLHSAFSMRQDIVERFFNEARAASSIADPGIVQIFDFGYQDGIAYIVMEFLDGEALEARLRRLGRLALVDALRLGRQLALSLQAAHARGVVHRDLKPDNVLVVPDAEVPGGERAKILDFGIAKLTDTSPDRQRTQTGMVMGTPLYMSPEQCHGAGSVDHRADIYSLGCMLFHLIAGRPPFESKGSGELLAMHLREPAPPVSQFARVPPHVDAILLRCLEKEPEDRFQTMQLLASEIDVALRAITIPPGGVDPAYLTPVPPAPGSVPPSAQPTTLSGAAAQTASGQAPRSRWPLVGIAATIVVAAAALVLVASRGPSSSELEPGAAPAPAAAPTAPTPTTTPPTPTPPTPTPIPTPPAEPAAAPAGEPTTVPAAEPAKTPTAEPTKPAEPTTTAGPTTTAEPSTAPAATPKPATTKSTKTTRPKRPRPPRGSAAQPVEDPYGER